MKSKCLTVIFLWMILFLTGCTAHFPKAVTGPDNMLLPGGHHKPVNRLVFSGSGRWLATGGYDRHIKVWNADTMTLKYDFSGHDRPVFSLAFSHDEAILASGDAGGTIRIRDLATGREILVIQGSSKAIGRLIFLPGSQHLAASGDDPAVHIWDSKTGVLLQTLEEHTEPVLALTPGISENTLFTGGLDKSLIQWDLKTGTPISRWPMPAPVTCMDILPDLKMMGVSLMNNTALIIDSETGNIRHTLSGHKLPVTAISFSSDGTKAVTASMDGTLRLWDAASGRFIGEMKAPSADKVADATFHPLKPNQVISAEWFDRIRIWDTETFQLYDTVDSQVSPILSLALNRSGSMLAAGTQQTGVQIWELPKDRLNRVLDHNTPIRSMSLHPEKPLLAYGTIHGEIMVWDLTAQQHQDGYLILEEYLPSRIITGLAYSRDGSLLAVRGKEGVYILNTEIGGMVFKKKAVNGGRQTLVFHPEKDMLAMSEGDVIHLITAQNEQKTRWHRNTLSRKHAHPITAIDFSHDGRYMASIDELGYLNIWDPYRDENGMVLFSWQITGTSGKPQTGSAVVFSPDGRHVAAGTPGGEILLFHLLEPEPVSRITGHPNGIHALTFNPKGDLLYSAGEDCLIRSWAVPDLQRMNWFTASREGISYELK